MVRAIVANGGGEVRQLHSGYNNVFLGGTGRVLLGEEKAENVAGGQL